MATCRTVQVVPTLAIHPVRHPISQMRSVRWAGLRPCLQIKMGVQSITRRHQNIRHAPLGTRTKRLSITRPRVTRRLHTILT